MVAHDVMRRVYALAGREYPRKDNVENEKTFLEEDRCHAPLRITVISHLGGVVGRFLPGVRRAIDMANDFMKKASSRPVVMLGAIVH